MKVIPIIPSASLAMQDASCNEDSGDVPKLDLPLTRRSLLRGSGVLMGTLAAGSVLTALAPSRAWALELKTLSSAEGTTLMKMGRTLYPHAKLPDAVYALLAKDLDAGATADSKTTGLLRDGIVSLDKAAGGNFNKASSAKQLAAVKSMEATPFFAAVRGKCVTSLYDNDMAFAAFGYPGSSWEKGGYITRGFQDLKWLPDPSKEASPAAWMG
jgi:hypothetical protein